uniref:Uncharacterized protein n=1 Tax=Candidatus Kentrum sp. DK TaxID=2126562 RepID=A0A450TNN8_9GAMM|nr:MAG: hypothetical protein BECKDK2373C_GA0170839_12163 [Candidatus Kentron sp. DK]
MLLPINLRETAIALQSNQNIRAAVSSSEEELHKKAILPSWGEAGWLLRETRARE